MIVQKHAFCDSRAHVVQPMQLVSQRCEYNSWSTGFEKNGQVKVSCLLDDREMRLHHLATLARRNFSFRSRGDLEWIEHTDRLNE